jgi:hypothetical protein
MRPGIRRPGRDLMCPTKLLPSFAIRNRHLHTSTYCLVEINDFERSTVGVLPKILDVGRQLDLYLGLTASDRLKLQLLAEQ